MDRVNSWKKTEEIEIDLADLLHSLLMRWKQIAVCALACAVVLGAAGWLINRSRADTGTAAAAEDAELSEAEEQAVADAVLLKQEISGLENYLEKSVLMQIDAYRKNRQIMLYRIDGAKRQELAAVTESYLSFLVNGGAADDLLKSDSGRSLDKNFLSELIFAYQKTYSSPYQLSINEQDGKDILSESLFYAEVTGKDAGEAQKLAEDLQEVLKAYAKKVQKSAGKHRLSLVSCMESVTADSELLRTQHDKKAGLSANKASLKTMTDGFSREQMAVYEEAVLEETRSVRKEEGTALDSKGRTDGNISGKTDSEQELEERLADETLSGEGYGIKTAVKYIVLGFAGGIFAYCCLFSCWYMFRDTVKSLDELKRIYAFPVYGVIPAAESSRNKSGSKKLPGVHRDAYGQTVEQVLNRIRLSCQKQKITKLCAVSDFPLDAAERKCLDSMAGQLEDFGIAMDTAENAGADTAAWDSLAEAGNVLMVFKIGVTTHRMIDDAMRFYLENGMAVAGAAAFLRDGNG